MAKSPIEKKRPWITASDGVHPKLRDLKPTEEEIKQSLASPGAALMSVDEKMVAHAAASVETYSANLRYYAGISYNGPDRAEKIRIYRLALAGALGDLGRFDEAVAVLSTPKGVARPGFTAPIKSIRAIQTAVDMRDDEECDCERPKVTVNALRATKAKPTSDLILNRRYVIGKVFSQKHNAVVPVLRCQFCGHTNATPNIPARQVQLEEIRLNNDAMVADLLRTGRRFTARQWVEKNFSPVAHSDEVLLASE